MTFKVNRQNLSEDYNTTSSWLSNHFSTRYSSTEKFATIEEKMEDIKSRVGFDKISSIEKSANCNCGGSCDTCSIGKECDCGVCRKCMSKKIKDTDLDEVRFLKAYIKDIVNDPIVPNTVSNVLSKCRENDHVGKILNKIKNRALLEDYVKDQFSNISSEGLKLNDPSMSYVSRSSTNSDSLEENKPEYVGYGSK